MKCWTCYLKGQTQNHLPDLWNTIPNDIKVSETCEVCGIVGIYVRETPKKESDTK